MKSSSLALLGIMLLFSFVSAAQEFEIPGDLPSSKDEFIKSEKDMINGAKWLESTPVGTQMDKRLKVNGWVVAWITNSPTVTVEVRESILKLFDKNSHLMIVFMAGYSRYCVENNYSIDGLKVNTAGIKSAINCYNLGVM